MRQLRLSFFVHKIKGVIGIVKLIHSKYGYETPEWTAADARLEKWLKQKKIDEKRRSDNERRILLEKNNYKKEGGAM
ncbi:hypothetical protein EFR36_09470 [Latilactobacillus curvatus]|nr:hypothetical protein [Latilactobacillus curvatus]QAS49708.1 hypothetical protein LCU_04615 [Latilactobacillus curvatus JCM 1096 = DSM 20019]ASN62243.1 hypothetical protein CGZ47_06685 [Latilactobacillus curvatus]AWV72686.1 hypothetical protein C0W45_03700 [Latilactobacillus curvatus]MCS8617812.1 hypothetical protein [Latilactobacillus curvatus]MCT2880379.1 hypothetical protein [Latilactobacillus curvatus]